MIFTKTYFPQPLRTQITFLEFRSSVKTLFMSDFCLSIRTRHHEQKLYTSKTSNFVYSQLNTTYDMKTLKIFIIN